MLWVFIRSASTKMFQMSIHNIHICGEIRKILKAPYSSKIDIFYQERLNKLIYGINTIIKCGIWLPLKFQLVLVLNWILYQWAFMDFYVGNINSDIQ